MNFPAVQVQDRKACVMFSGLCPVTLVCVYLLCSGGLPGCRDAWWEGVSAVGCGLRQDQIGLSWTGHHQQQMDQNQRHTVNTHLNNMMSWLWHHQTGVPRVFSVYIEVSSFIYICDDIISDFSFHHHKLDHTCTSDSGSKVDEVKFDQSDQNTFYFPAHVITWEPLTVTAGLCGTPILRLGNTSLNDWRIKLAITHQSGWMTHTHTH